MTEAGSADHLVWLVGDVRVTCVRETTLSVDPVHLLPRATPGALREHGWLRPWALDRDGAFVLPVQSFCIEADGSKLLVDACFGPGPLPESMSARRDDGRFLRRLAAIGFGRDDVDIVVNTHLHVDHVGWNTLIDETGRVVPTFRQARYLVVADELDHWRSADEADRHAHAVVTFDSAVQPLFDHGVAEVVEPGVALTSSVRLLHTPGHSPGHVAVEISSRGERALITGDAVHSPVQFAEPTWGSSVDVSSDESTATRLRMIADVVDADVLVLGTHFADPVAGHVVSTVDGIRFRPHKTDS